jgi:DNA-binding transcriptional LysR family regulator
LKAKTTISIDDLKVYTTVVRLGSFTAAAEAMDTNKAHVSRVVTRLEKQLSSQLLLRSTRSLNVTEVGRELYERSIGIIAALEETQASITQAQTEPQGSLRITAGFDFGTLKVDNWIASHLQRHPKMRVETDYTNRITDVIHEGIDIAIRLGPLPDSELSARKLGEIHYGLYATSKYLDGRSIPANIDDLKSHNLIFFSPRGKPNWKLVNDHQMEDVDGEGFSSVSNIVTAYNLIKQHLGISLLPHFMVQENLQNKELVQILPDWNRIPVPVHAVFASSRYMAPKVRSFIDLCIEEFDL